MRKVEVELGTWWNLVELGGGTSATRVRPRSTAALSKC